jgi:hypothetical protein
MLVTLTTQGTSAAQSCDPNYSGGCVPNVWPEDVDCLGGDGNGPYYTDGTHTSKSSAQTDTAWTPNDQDTIACEQARLRN